MLPARLFAFGILDFFNVVPAVEQRLEISFPFVVLLGVDGLRPPLPFVVAILIELKIKLDYLLKFEGHHLYPLQPECMERCKERRLFEGCLLTDLWER